jgi:hypothetical protein
MTWCEVAKDLRLKQQQQQQQQQRQCSQFNTSAV